MTRSQPPEPEKKPRFNPRHVRLAITLLIVALFALLGWLVQTYT